MESEVLLNKEHYDSFVLLVYIVLLRHLYEYSLLQFFYGEKEAFRGKRKVVVGLLLANLVFIL